MKPVPFRTGSAMTAESSMTLAPESHGQQRTLDARRINDGETCCTVLADAARTCVHFGPYCGGANWTAGPLSGTTRFAYDYDGLKTIKLELPPTETEVERVQLVIPLKASEAWLMHPVTTTLRQHYAGRIPSGKEKVWDSSQVHDRLNGTFVPYIYLGGPERGICFAADNDRDWITDGGTPMMVIDREGDTVLLRLNLIAKPSRLTRKRTLTFALQAAPRPRIPRRPGCRPSRPNSSASPPACSRRRSRTMILR